jgi:hypothetical protein
MRFFLAVLTAVLVFSGCAQREVRTISIPEGSNQLASHPAELRATYSLAHKSSIRLCAEPPPDVGLSSTVGVTVTPPGGGQSGGNVENTVVKLEGRTALVLLAREMLYRACEAFIDRNEAVSKMLYEEALKAITDIGTSIKIESVSEIVVAITSSDLSAEDKATTLKKLDLAGLVDGQTSADTNR